MSNRKAFTMVELISVIVIIGILSSVAIPKFSGVKDQAKKATELSTAQAISAALESIHSTWSTSDGDFDWNNDGIDDDIAVELAKSGYPLDLERNSDDIGAILRASSKSGFKKKGVGVLTQNGARYRLYTAKASDPVSGVKFASSESRDIEGKPDKNDIWIYMIDTNNTSEKCFVEVSGASQKRQITSGDFMLLDVNMTGTTEPTNIAISFGG
jgi:prepilin-type N-terminal cleavage/methylation domain-containing protein